MSYLAHEQLLAAHDAAVAAGLDRDALLSGIDPALVGMLHDAPNPTSQILSDLSALNQELDGGSAPLVTWFRNARSLAAAHRLEAELFASMLSELSPAAHLELVPPVIAAVDSPCVPSRRLGDFDEVLRHTAISTVMVALRPQSDGGLRCLVVLNFRLRSLRWPLGIALAVVLAALLASSLRAPTAPPVDHPRSSTSASPASAPLPPIPTSPAPPPPASLPAPAPIAVPESIPRTAPSVRRPAGPAPRAPIDGPKAAPVVPGPRHSVVQDLIHYGHYRYQPSP